MTYVLIWLHAVVIGFYYGIRVGIWRERTGRVKRGGE